MPTQAIFPTTFRTALIETATGVQQPDNDELPPATSLWQLNGVQPIPHTMISKFVPIIVVENGEEPPPTDIRFHVLNAKDSQDSHIHVIRYVCVDSMPPELKAVIASYRNCLSFGDKAQFAFFADHVKTLLEHVLELQKTCTSEVTE